MYLRDIVYTFTGERYMLKVEKIKYQSSGKESYSSVTFF